MVVVVVMMEANQQNLVKCSNNNNNNNITNHPTPVSQALARRQLWLHRRRWRPRHHNKSYHLSSYNHLNNPPQQPHLKVPVPEFNQLLDVAKVSSINKWLPELAYPFAHLAKPKFGEFLCYYYYFYLLFSKIEKMGLTILFYYL
jgi:hypothetical protein